MAVSIRTLSVVAALLTTLAFATTEAAEEPCGDEGFQEQDYSCPSDKVEIWKTVIKLPGFERFNPFCCPKASTDGIKHWRANAGACRTSMCGRPSATDLCTSPRNLYTRYPPGSNTPYEYEEIMRDSCKRDDGSNGVAALCCRKNSDEGTLMTAYGAELNEFPHQAKLFVPSNCGGTIYNERVIITAAHCVVNKVSHETEPASVMKVILGTNNAQLGDTDESYEYRVEKVYVHKNYSKSLNHPELEKENPDTYNDIALLFLDRDIDFNDHVKALQIAPKNFDPFKHAGHAVIVGWGTTETLQQSAHLQKANFILRNDQVCNDRYGNQMGDMKTLLCVGGVLEGKWSYTAGTGDSGGPAICRGADGRAVLCGVTSYGGDDEACHKNNDQESCPPSVYTEVAFFHDWIVKHAGKKQDSSQFYQPTLYGKDVKKGEYDHQVHITSASGKPCGGTLISPSHVLTAQQCVAKPDGTQHDGLQVTAGITELNGDGETFGVSNVEQLPDFKRVGKPVNIKAQGHHVYMTDNFYKNDMALVKLDGSVNISPSKLPKLPEVGESYTEGVEVALPRENKFGGKMRSRKFKILDPNDCQGRMNRLSHTKIGKIKVGKDIMCGVEKYNGGSQCDRELGGGVICKGNVLCGIQVFRLCDLSIPNGFLNLAYHSSWIKNAMLKPADLMG